MRPAQALACASAQAQSCADPQPTKAGFFTEDVEELAFGVFGAPKTGATKRA